MLKQYLIFNIWYLIIKYIIINNFNIIYIKNNTIIKKNINKK